MNMPVIPHALLFSCKSVWLFATPWTVTHQVPLSIEFSRQEYCSGLPFPSPGDLPDPGIELVSPELARDSFTAEPPGKPLYLETEIQIGAVTYSSSHWTPG